MSKRKIKYELKRFGTIPENKVQVVGERLAFISEKMGGKLKPEDVINDAVNVRSPLHNFFEWDDNEASNKWRMHQARMIINSIAEVVVIEGKRSKMNSFFSVTEKETNSRAYVSLREVAKDQDYLDELYNRLIKHLENATLTLKSIKKLRK